MPAMRKVSNGQLEELVKQMESHPLLARVGARIGGPQTKQTIFKQWEIIASRLNAVGDGVCKSPKEWRLYWTDLKYRVRSKESQLENYHQTGGEPVWKYSLSPIEERICSFIGVQANVGNQEVRIKIESPPPAPPAVVTSTPGPYPSTSKFQFLPTPAVLDEKVALSPPHPLCSPHLSSPHPLCSPHPLSPSDPLSSPEPLNSPRPLSPSRPHLEERQEAAMQLTMEERLLSVAETQLEEDRQFRRMMDQRTGELLQLLKETLAALLSLPRQNNYVS